MASVASSGTLRCLTSVNPRAAASRFACRGSALISTTAAGTRTKWTAPVPRTATTMQQPLCPLMTRRYGSSGSHGYTNVRALVFAEHGDPGKVLGLHTHSISPDLPANSVLLRALATPINPADVNMIQGVYPARPPFTKSLTTEIPVAVGGNEGCFEVQAIGSKVQSLSVGDWVVMKHTAQGTWRTHLMIESEGVLKIDNKEGLTPIQVGTVSVNPCTAYRMLKDFVDLKEGDWFMQNGANSGVGRAAIQLGKEWGLKSINVIRDRPTKEETDAMKQELRDLGATVVITSEELADQDFRDNLAAELKQDVGSKKPAKLMLNCVGGRSAMQMCKLMAPGGHMVTYGAMSKQPLSIRASHLIFSDYKFSGFWVSRWSDQNPEEKLRTVNDILDLTRQGKFRDIPVEKIDWKWDTMEKTLKAAVTGTLEGFRPGKSIFVYDHEGKK